MYNLAEKQEQFHHAFSKYGDRLYYYVLKLSGSEEKAKDTVQESFLRLWENIAIVDMNSDLLPLLLVYARNLLTDDFRKKQKHQQAMQSLQDNKVTAVSLPEIEQQLDLKDRQQQFLHSVAHLPEKRQTVFRLIKQEGFSYSEAAKHLGLSLPDVKKQMRLSLQMLRKIMQLFSL